MNEQVEVLDPCRVIIIGLPYSGMKSVARILSQHHGCSLLQLPQQSEKPDDECRRLLFNDYRGQAVFVMAKCNYSLLKSMRKRNFVNVVYVSTPFKTRLNNYCQLKNVEKSLEVYEEFAELDQQSQNQDYKECIEFARVRIHNTGSLDDLKVAIANNINEIVRPFRPDYDQYFMKIADVARRRSNCMKASVGAVIVNDNNRVVSTGYNGTPRGIESCFKDGCPRCNSNSSAGLDECLCMHGEESAILEVGISRTAGCKLYTTMYPCFSCAKIIKQAGIKKIFYMDPYNKEDNGAKFLKQNFKEEDIVQVRINDIYY